MQSMQDQVANLTKVARFDHLLATGLGNVFRRPAKKSRLTAVVSVLKTAVEAVKPAAETVQIVEAAQPIETAATVTKTFTDITEMGKEMLKDASAESVVITKDDLIYNTGDPAKDAGNIVVIATCPAAAVSETDQIIRELALEGEISNNLIWQILSTVKIVINKDKRIQGNRNLKVYAETPGKMFDIGVDIVYPADPSAIIATQKTAKCRLFPDHSGCDLGTAAKIVDALTAGKKPSKFGGAISITPAAIFEVC